MNSSVWIAQLYVVLAAPPKTTVRPAKHIIAPSMNGALFGNAPYATNIRVECARIVKKQAAKIASNLCASIVLIILAYVWTAIKAYNFILAFRILKQSLKLCCFSYSPKKCTLGLLTQELLQQGPISGFLPCFVLVSLNRPPVASELLVG